MIDVVVVVKYIQRWLEIARWHLMITVYADFYPGWCLTSQDGFYNYVLVNDCILPSQA